MLKVEVLVEQERGMDESQHGYLHVVLLNEPLVGYLHLV